MELCKFLWTGAALISLHITRPFIIILQEHKVTPMQLLVILSELYKNLKEYPMSLCQISTIAILALKAYFLYPYVKETSPYVTDVSKGYQNL